MDAILCLVTKSNVYNCLDTNQALHNLVQNQCPYLLEQGANKNINMFMCNHHFSKGRSPD